jgi:hypothetical protein
MTKDKALAKPVAWINAKGDMTYLHGPYNNDDRPLIYGDIPLTAPVSLTDLEKDAAALLFALHDAWPYVHQWCTIESKRKSILALMRKHGDFADLA